VLLQTRSRRRAAPRSAACAVALSLGCVGYGPDSGEPEGDSRLAEARSAVGGPEIGTPCTSAQDCHGHAGCFDGTCLCNPGFAACGTECVDLSTNAANCGACKHACAVGATCVEGVCSGGNPLLPLTTVIGPFYVSALSSSGCTAAYEGYPTVSVNSTSRTKVRLSLSRRTRRRALATPKRGSRRQLSLIRTRIWVGSSITIRERIVRRPIWLRRQQSRPYERPCRAICTADIVSKRQRHNW
jgi:hypothetical protein